METPKTKQVSGMMKNLGVADKKALFVYPGTDINLYLSLRNIPNAAGMELADINTYDIMNADVMVLTESAAKIFSEVEEGTEAHKACSY